MDKDAVQFEVPPLRTDIWHDVDITDDIIRAYGVNALQYSLPAVATIGHVRLENRLRDKMTELLIGCSFQQLFTLALTDKNEQFVKMRLPLGKYIALGHAAEQSINMVRTWILPEVLKSLAFNKSRSYPQNVFEIEEVVIPDDTKDVLCENRLKLCAAIADAQVDYTSIKQHLVYVLESLGIKDYSFAPLEHASFLAGRAAKVLIDKQEIGLIGELHPQVLLNFNIETPVCAFEIDVDLLTGL
jgi:phenylalanyl-tRNA synthetase beta chain